MTLVAGLVKGLCVEGTPLPPDTLEMWGAYTGVWQAAKGLLHVETGRHGDALCVSPSWLKVGWPERLGVEVCTICEG